MLKSLASTLVGVIVGWNLYGADPQINKFTSHETGLTHEAGTALVEMKAAAARDGVQLQEGSTRRTADEQLKLWLKWRAGLGPVAAAPGYSKHEVGLAVDFRNMRTESKPGHSWLVRNGNKYGFYRTVPSEPWHWEYKGN